MSTNKISAKIPEPNLTQETAIKPSRKYNRPKVGVVDVPSISQTPLSDAYIKRKKENPYTKYKINFKNTSGKKGFKFHAIISLTIIAAAIAHLFTKK